MKTSAIKLYLHINSKNNIFIKDKILKNAYQHQ